MWWLQVDRIRISVSNQTLRLVAKNVWSDELNGMAELSPPTILVVKAYAKIDDWWTT